MSRYAAGCRIQQLWDTFSAQSVDVLELQKLRLEKMFRVNVSLPSGRFETLSLPPTSTTGDLKVLAQKSLRQGFLRLVSSKGHVLTNPMESLQVAGIEEGEHLTAVVQQPKVAATSAAFAVWCCGGDRIVTWGDPSHGAGSAVIEDQHRNIQQVHGTRGIFGGAFAAILADGSVVTWGDPGRGGDSSAVQDQLRNVQQVQATGGAFAAILADGSVVTWGNPGSGGDSSAVRDQLRTVQQVQAAQRAFAAILADGSVVTWGDPDNELCSSRSAQERAASSGHRKCICRHLG